MPPAPQPAAPPVTARIRLYRQGLGDCILLTLQVEGEDKHQVLIDCGVYQTTSGGKARMREVVDDLVTETGGRLDLVVATHQHFDHISGFNQAADLFAAADEVETAGKLQAERVWLGWTEDPKDRVAARLDTEKANALAGLEAAEELAQALATRGGRKDQHAAGLAQGLDGVLGFFGAAGGRTTLAALDIVRSLSKTPIRYCRPTDAPWTGIPGVRIYVLGPPLDPKAIFQLMVESEVYHAAQNGFAATDFVSLLQARANGCDPESDSAQPFDVTQRVRLDFDLDSDTVAPAASEADRFFLDHYLGASADTQQPDQQWRRIDSDWLGPASDLAIKLDNATNNTSLVLAIELIDSGKVLLFPGDAQVGSWLSWGSLSWEVDGWTVTGEELLRRVAFYKVGHHGSHNATLKARGLELMDRDDLVAFIPVDEVMAKKVGWGRMPLPSIEAALQDRAAGRVVRTDRDYAGAGLAPGDPFATMLRKTDLYYEIEVSG